MTAPSYDVLVVGGGVIGSSVAYHLTANPGFQGRVAVIEPDPSYAGASSSLSTSAIRQQFGAPANIAMSAFGIDFLRRASDLLSVDGEPAEISLREPGYLILGRPDQAAKFEARHAVQRACGVDVELLGPADLRRRFPWLNVEDVGVGSFGRDKEGWFDGPGLAQALRRRARAQGVQYLHDRVVGFERRGPAIEAARLAQAGRLPCGVVVDAAGAWSGEVARLAGLDVPVVPRRRCIFVFDSPAGLANAPFVFDVSGALVRPEGRLYICGIAPTVENADDDFSLDVDHALFDQAVWPALARRIPGFEQLRLLRAWAGLYDVNLFDHNAIIGPHPGVPNFIFACGFSGHGMMHAPAAGAAVSCLIVRAGHPPVDVRPFAYERIAAGQMIAEHVY